VSTTVGYQVGGRELDGRPSVARAAALAGAATLVGSFLVVLVHVLDVVGSPTEQLAFVAVVLAALGLGVALGRVLSLRYAVVLGTLMLGVGLGAYLVLVPGVSATFDRELADTISLLTGLSVLRMTQASIWALGFAPGPVFVSTYLFVRRRYALGALVGGATLAFFISTGDVDVVHGLVGFLGAVAAVGFGQLDREGATRAQLSGVVVVMVAILVVTTSVSVVPGAPVQPLLPGGGGQTIESSLVGGGNSVTVQGSIELSPTVRFVVTANHASAWRVGAFDRYTGSGWVRSGRSLPYTGQLDRPPSANSILVRQRFQAQSEVAVMPAAWKPLRVLDASDRTMVTAMGSLAPAGTLKAGDQYTVLSEVSQPSVADLRAAGTDYPADVVDQFTQLPESTPRRVGTFTASVTAGTNDPYDAAVAVEDWLRTNKRYSLDVNRPRGDVASGFIFDMNQGYCTYFATAMVVMLRTQGIPARFVVGYTHGQPVDGNTFVVRGIDAHAWVEVYFPGHGWVAFDPTPAAPRQAAEQQALAQARAAGVPNVDTPLTEPSGSSARSTPAPPGTPRPSDGNGSVRPVRTLTAPPGGANPGAGGGGPGGGGGGFQLPDPRTVLYGLILLAGGLTAAYRTGLLERLRRALWVRRAPDGPPERRLEATFARLDYLLGRRYRPRRPGETPRAYLEALQSGFSRAEWGDVNRSLTPLFDLYERAHYAGRCSPAEADRAWRLLCDLRARW